MATAGLSTEQGFPTVDEPAGWSSPDEGGPGSVPPKPRCGAPLDGPARFAPRLQHPASSPGVPRRARDRSGGRRKGVPPHMATTRTNLSDFDLPGARLRSRSLKRLGAGLLTGAAASVSLVLTPVTADAAEPSSSTAAPSSAAQTAVDTARSQ